MAVAVVQRDHEYDDLWSIVDSVPEGHPARRDARNALVERHMPLVRYLAQRYVNRGESLDDLVQVGAVGLIKAVERFDPGRGLAFSTFATPTVLGEIKRHFRDKAWMVRVPRPLQELKAQVTRAREELSQSLGRAPTIEQIAELIGVTEEQVLESLEAGNAYAAVSIHASMDDDSSLDSMIEARVSEIDERFELVDQRHSIAPLLDALPERERRMIFLRYFREMTQVQIAEELGISQMHVSRVLSQTIETLRRQVVDVPRQ